MVVASHRFRVKKSASRLSWLFIQLTSTCEAPWKSTPKLPNMRMEDSALWANTNGFGKRRRHLGIQPVSFSWGKEISPPNDLKDERPKLPKIVPQKWGLYIYIYGYWISHVYIYRPTKLTGNIYIYTYVWHPLHPIYTYIKYIYGIHAENATLPFWGQYAFFQWEVLILETKSQYLSEARGVSMTNFFWVETLVKSKWSFFPQQQ